MQILLLVLLIFTMIGLISGFLMFWRLHLPQADLNTKTLPFLTIIIPARDEAMRLPMLFKSLQNQSVKAFEVIVVDDDSSDNTVEIAIEYGAKVLKNNPVKDMTSGKSTACALGAKHASGEWLMFLDADVKLMEKDSLFKILTSYQKQNGIGILSIQPYHHINKIYENFSAVFNIIVLTGINTFTIWKQKFKTAGAFGPCLLCDQKSYFSVGGHDGIKESIMDDFALSHLFIQEELPVTNYGGKEVIAIRMYPEGLKSLNEGWTKNMATASQSTHSAVMVFINLWILGALFATIMPILAFINQNTLYFILTCFIYLFYGLQVFILARRVGNFNYLTIAFYPVLFFYFIILFLHSLYRTHILGTVMWKGRKIKV